MDCQGNVLNRPEIIIKNFQVFNGEFIFGGGLSHGSLFTCHPSGEPAGDDIDGQVKHNDGDDQN